MRAGITIAGNMITTSVKFAVRKPIDQVFALIGDIAAYNEWAPQSSMVYLGTTITSAGRQGLHTTFVDRMRFGCRSVGQIVRYDPPHRLAIDQTTHSIVPLFSSFIEYRLSTEGEQTVVHHTVVPKAHGVHRLLGLVHEILLDRERNAFCQAIMRKLDDR